MLNPVIPVKLQFITKQDCEKCGERLKCVTDEYPMFCKTNTRNYLVSQGGEQDPEFPDIFWIRNKYYKILQDGRIQEYTAGSTIKDRIKNPKNHLV